MVGQVQVKIVDLELKRGLVSLTKTSMKWSS